MSDSIELIQDTVDSFLNSSAEASSRSGGKEEEPNQSSIKTPTPLPRYSKEKK